MIKNNSEQVSLQRTNSETGKRMKDDMAAVSPSIVRPMSARDIRKQPSDLMKAQMVAEVIEPEEEKKIEVN